MTLIGMLSIFVLASGSMTVYAVQIVSGTDDDSGKDTIRVITAKAVGSGHVREEHTTAGIRG